MCDPQNGCNAQFLCGTVDPQAAGCPISSRKYKDDVTYITAAERKQLAGELLQMKLARWQYTLPDQPQGDRVGFIIEDHPDSTAVDGEHVDLYGLAGLLMATVQEQQARIDALEAQVQELKTECAP